MDNTEGAPAAAAGISLADHEAAVAKAKTDGKTEGSTEAGKAAQTRIKTIVGSDEAKGRTDMANHLAFETDMSAEASIALLAKSPKGEVPKAATPSIAERQDLALGGVESRQSAKIDPAALNAGAIYDNRRKARGSRIPAS